jgi:hypothetical protein
MDSDMDLQYGSMVDEGRSDDESDDESEISAGPQLEPRRRPPSTETPIQVTAAADLDITADEEPAQAGNDPTLRGVRQLAERQLEQQPFVVPYPSQRVENLVGARTRVQDHRQSAHANVSYELEIAQDKTNPYAPFTSQLDWNIAKWAKLCGPGSTAFGELMTIPGVSLVESVVRRPSNAFQVHENLQISFKGPQELNRIIDDKLPGRPPFKRHEVLVDNEVCEVYYRDIISCIRALFGDPDFASMLVFWPEKHYVDEKNEERMYHDIHTGRWWWCTQVST